MIKPEQVFHYHTTDAAGFAAVQPLWEQQRAYHAALPWHFAEDMRRAQFEQRKQEMLNKAAPGKLLVELVSAGADAKAIAYCISTVTAEGVGEIDSLFVEEAFRGGGIGSELIRRSLAWFDRDGATKRTVAVAHANKEALALYERFGFHARTVMMQQ